MGPEVVTPEREHWLGPLMEAAEEGKDKGQKATLLTPWTDQWVNGKDAEAGQLHDAYSVSICGAMGRSMPWLPPLLRDAAAYVVAEPGAFWFALPADPSKRYAVEEMRAHTYFLPWTTEAERSMPQ
jgi:hypothetical protein